MPARRILQLGDPVLRKASAPVGRPERVTELVRDLRATLHAFRRKHGFGRAISAVQIGDPKRVIYLEHEGAFHALINPTFEELSAKTFRLWDDCFSFPDLLVRVERSVSFRLRFQNLSGAWRKLEGSGALSELVQHEMDHLDGVLAVDRAADRFSLCTRAEYDRHFGKKKEARRKP